MNSDTAISVWPEKDVSAAYIHIPFCLKRCTYCDFTTFTLKNENMSSRYVDALNREIAGTAAWQAAAGIRSRPLSTLYLGGGTPTVLPAADLIRLLETVRNYFGLSADAECTLEANPGAVSFEQLESIRRAGFNRISFGLQAVQPQLLDILGRIHTAQEARDSLELAKRAGFSNIGVDILFGIPGQTDLNILETLSFLDSLPIDHVSYYGLILEPDTALTAAVAAGTYSMPSDEQERTQYHLLRDNLVARGFEPYEISSSARRGFASRHNLTYWQGLPYYGFGCGAHMYLSGWRGHNPLTLTAYLNAQESRAEQSFVQTVWGDQPDLPGVVWQEQIDRQEAIKEMLLLGLRTMRGVCQESFRRRFALDLTCYFAKELHELEAKGRIEQKAGCIRLSRLGLDFANEVFRQFI